jgi:hypothetical protein
MVMGLLLAGCGTATTYWCHPTKPMAEAFPKDRYVCDGESYRRAEDRGEKGDPDVIKEEWERCMRSRGWSPCSKYQGR